MAPSHSNYNFFRIILASSLQNKRLLIPRKLIENHGKDLSSPVCLKLPNGVEWKVELAFSDGVVWLKNGLDQVIDFYSLQIGSLLVFKYDCHSVFNTMIFKTTGTEIEYPPRETHLPRRRLRLRRGSSIDDDFQAHDLPEKKKKKKVDDEFLVVKKEITSGDEAEENYLPKNPFFVYVVRSLTYKHARLNIPVSFGRENFRQGTQMVKLQIKNKQWKVKVIKGRRFRFSAGWRLFSRENSLKEGDKCVFELINRKDFVFKVTVFKGKALPKNWKKIWNLPIKTKTLLIRGLD